MFRRLPLILVLATTACADAGFEKAYASVADAPMVLAEARDYDRGEQGLAGFITDQESRQLIRTGSVGLVIDDWATFQAALNAKLAEDSAFVGDASLSHVEGEVSNANLTLRVPVDQFDELVSWLEQSAEVRYVEVHSADVTRQWVDLQSRIENGQRAADRLRELLATQTGDLEDVLAVERELARVQGEVEQAQRESQGMKEQITLSTVSVNVEVRSRYTPAVVQSLPNQVQDTFVGSIEAMGEVAKTGLLAGVALAPWLAVLTGVLAGAFVGLRRLLRRA